MPQVVIVVLRGEYAGTRMCYWQWQLILSLLSLLIYIRCAQFVQLFLSAGPVLVLLVLPSPTVLCDVLSWLPTTVSIVLCDVLPSYATFWTD